MNKLCGFLEGHPEFGRESVDKALVNLNRVTLNAFFRHLQKELKNTSISVIEAGVKRFCLWANSDWSNYLHPRPLFVKGQRRAAAPPARTLPKALKFNDIVELMLRCHHEAQRVVIHAAYDTGIRISEIPRVTRGDLPDLKLYPREWNYFGLHVLGSKGRGQTLKERKTIISRPVLARLARHHNTKVYRKKYGDGDPSAPAFVNVHGEKWTEDALESMFRRARDRAGLDEAHLHMLRHGYALSVMASKHGRDAIENLIVVNQTLGHSQLSTTQVYTRLGLEALSQLLNAMGTAEYEHRFQQQEELFKLTFLPERKNPTARVIGVKHEAS
jgi:integrase/recombinase XerC